MVGNSSIISTEMQLNNHYSLLKMDTFPKISQTLTQF